MTAIEGFEYSDARPVRNLEPLNGYHKRAAVIEVSDGPVLLIAIPFIRKETAEAVLADITGVTP